MFAEHQSTSEYKDRLQQFLGQEQNAHFFRLYNYGDSSI
jgi:hypothetical protein